MYFFFPLMSRLLWPCPVNTQHHGPADLDVLLLPSNVAFITAASQLVNRSSNLQLCPPDFAERAWGSQPRCQ